MHRTTTSIDIEDYNFIKEHNIQVSDIIRNHIKSVREAIKTSRSDIEKLNIRLADLANQLRIRIKFIEDKGLMREFETWNR